MRIPSYAILAASLALVGVSLPECGSGPSESARTPTIDEIQEQERDEARQELEHEVGEAAREEGLR